MVDVACPWALDDYGCSLMGSGWFLLFVMGSGWLLLFPNVTALHNSMSWKSIRRHLIGAEDLNDVDYLYVDVASA